MKTLSTEEFTCKASLLHGGKYNYSKVDFVNTRILVTIVCPLHGEFKIRPANHLKGQGCKTCGHQKKVSNRFHAKQLTTESFAKKAQKIHGSLYDYTQTSYRSGGRVKVLIGCKTHGYFSQLPSHHLQGRGCPTCAGKGRTTKTYVELAARRHQNKYDYSVTEFTTNADTITIICPEHGPYLQRAGNHLKGAGCKQCTQFGFNRTPFVNAAKKRSAILYLLECNADSEHFYKIGITTILPNRLRLFPFKPSVIYTYESHDGSLVYDIEKHLHRLFKGYRYTPTIKFGGSKECYLFTNINAILPLLEEGLNYIKQLHRE